MGCGSRAGKKEQHSNGKPNIDQQLCRGCRRCLRECANSALVFDTVHQKMTVNKENCVGCGRCLGSCNYDAISFDNDAAVEQLNCRMAEYAKAVVDGRPCFHISLVVDVSPTATVMEKMTCLFCLIWVCLHPLIRCIGSSLCRRLFESYTTSGKPPDRQHG